jgi:hypothetical protein
LEETTKHAKNLNSVVSNWPLTLQLHTTNSEHKKCVESIEKTRNMMNDIKIKDALTNQLAKERVLETQLSQHEQEWKREGQKTYRYQQCNPSPRSSQRKYSIDRTTDRPRVDHSTPGRNNRKTKPSRTNEDNGSGSTTFN